MPPNSKNDVLSEITNICRLRSQNCQNATSLKVSAGIKQAFRLVLRFEGQNNLFGGNVFILLWYMFKTNFSGQNKILLAQKYLGTLSLNAPMATGMA